MSEFEVLSKKVDAIDKHILNFLMTNADRPIAILAKEVGISNTAIHHRIKKLKSMGLIDNIVLQMDPKAMGYSTTAFIGIYMDRSASYHEVVEELKKIPEVLESYFTTGDYALFIKVICTDNEHLMDVISNKIQPISGVTRTESLISLQQNINRQVQV